MAKIVRNCPQLSKTVQNIQKLSKYESDSTDENKNYQGCGIYICLALVKKLTQRRLE